MKESIDRLGKKLNDFADKRETVELLKYVFPNLKQYSRFYKGVIARFYLSLEIIHRNDILHIYIYG